MIRTVRKYEKYGYMIEVDNRAGFILRGIKKYLGFLWFREAIITFENSHEEELDEQIMDLHKRGEAWVNKMIKVDKTVEKSKFYFSKKLDVAQKLKDL